ncbi:HAD family hydrolase [Paenibacillus sp. S33]
MNTIRLIACDVDGILLTDTFSPVQKSLVKKAGMPYTREIERNVFSRQRSEAVAYLKQLFRVSSSEADSLRDFFGERDNYMANHDSGLIDGALAFLNLLSTQNVRLVCYGGLAEEKLLSHFKYCKPFFETYICTNDFRPGIKEITRDIYGLEYHEVLFIDNVNTVAEVAKSLNAPFIGVPSTPFQYEDMKQTGVKYLLNSLKGIDAELLERIDLEAAEQAVWSNHAQ